MDSDPSSRSSYGSRYMTGAEVRRAFLDFFAAKAHLEVPSSSLVPHNDPTVLLTTAGMQQMTPYFLGLETPPGPRLTSVQKCFRTVDIDEVGDESHCTFFFMLGNFSVGDYFKRESLAWSWEFFTEVMGLDPERLYPTVHPDDTDAYAIWRDEIGVPEARIGKLSDNWWGPVGATGPNGPDSEIYFDLGPEHGDEGDGPGDGSRYLEVWNNVFMEFLQNPDGSRTPLPRQHVDTGMGLERLTMLMQRGRSVYDTDLYQRVIETICSLCDAEYGVDRETDRSLRVIADHIRGATFLIGDGVLPGNEGRSYVLRRLLRRAIRHCQRLGINGRFLEYVSDEVITQFGSDYHELYSRGDHINRVLLHEVESFGRTLGAGLSHLADIEASHLAQAVTENRPSRRMFDAIRDVLQPSQDVLQVLRKSQEPALAALQAAALVEERQKELARSLARAVQPIIDLQNKAATSLAKTVQPIRDQQERMTRGLADAVLPIIDRQNQIAAGVAKAVQPILDTQAQVEKVLQPILDVQDAVEAALNPELVDQFERVIVQPISGEEAFRLYDTYGFPIDLTVEIARERGLTVDLAGFEAAMSTQRAASRGGAAFKASDRDRAEVYVRAARGVTTFLGYEHSQAEATIVALVGPDGQVDEAEAGQDIDILLDRTPFYGESGGQVGDTGTIRTETGVVSIDTTFKPTPDVILHRGIVAEGFVRAGETAHAAIDGARRRATQRNHTATHLLHRALRTVLGEETHQAGSLVAPDRLRFDFTSVEAMAPEQVARVGEIVNAEVLMDRPVSTHERPYKEAVADGAMALFGEKYGDVVRVVDVEGFSRELCGGTHVGSTAEIGPFLVVSEGSVASGVRRVEALTGDAAVERMLAQQRVLDGLSRDLKTPWRELPAAIGTIQERARSADRESAQLRGQLAGARAEDLLAGVVEIEGVKLLATRVDVSAKEELRQLGDRMRDKLGSGVVALGAVVDERPSLLVMVTKDIVGRGVRAGDLVREIAPIVDGRGGGRPDLAEAGGRNAGRLDEAMAAVEGLVRSALTA